MPDKEKDCWSKPQTILVATDLTDLDRLMPFALEQARNSGAKLILQHVLAVGVGIAMDAAGMPYYDPTGPLESAQEALAAWCESTRQKGVACEALVREGHAAQQIQEAAANLHADRILLGTRSRGKLEKLFLGSVAEQVLRSVNLPVITVGPEAHLPSEDESTERVVLHATTLRDSCRPSAALACELAASQRAKLVLLHVLPPLDEMQKKGLPTGLDSTALHELRQLARETDLGCCTTVDAHVVHGNPSIEILAEASERRASLIVLGATERLPLEKLARNRTIYRILAHARCPVLTLRECPGKTAEDEASHLAAQS
jgi:nucleotide-binding universal stress UspA family protein